MVDLQGLWQEVLRDYTADREVIASLWAELEGHYTEPGRHYHNLEHLRYMLALAQQHRARIQDWPAFVLAIYYHDAIYDAQRKDNEARSAELAVARLGGVGVPAATLQRMDAHIRATQGHQTQPDPDTNLLLDIDLGMLGEARDRYAEYTRQIRQEYRIYPDDVYYPGRQQVLQHFLAMERIYKTKAFAATHEQPARANLAWELQGK